MGARTSLHTISERNSDATSFLSLCLFHPKCLLWSVLAQNPEESSEEQSQLSPMTIQTYHNRVQSSATLMIKSWDQYLTIICSCLYALRVFPKASKKILFFVTKVAKAESVNSEVLILPLPQNSQILELSHVQIFYSMLVLILSQMTGSHMLISIYCYQQWDPCYSF